MTVTCLKFSIFGPDIPKIETIFKEADINFIAKEEYHIASRTNQTYYCEYNNEKEKEKIISLINQYKDGLTILQVPVCFIYRITEYSLKTNGSFADTVSDETHTSLSDALEIFSLYCTDLCRKQSAVLLTRRCFESTSSGLNLIGKEETLKTCYS